MKKAKARAAASGDLVSVSDTRDTHFGYCGTKNIYIVHSYHDYSSLTDKASDSAGGPTPNGEQYAEAGPKRL